MHNTLWRTCHGVQHFVVQIVVNLYLTLLNDVEAMAEFSLLGYDRSLVELGVLEGVGLHIR